MKFVIKIIFIAVISYLLLDLLPWWGFTIVAFLANAIVYEKGVPSFFSGFIALFVLWLSLSWSMSSYGDHLMTQRIASLFSFNDPYLLLILIGFLGAILGGLSSLTGCYFRSIFVKKRTSKYY